MTHQVWPTPRAVILWGALPLCALFALLSSPTILPVRAEPPKADEPLFQVVDERPYQLAAQAVLAANTPGTGSWAILEVLYDGAPHDAAAGRLPCPLTSRMTRSLREASTP